MNQKIFIAIASFLDKELPLTIQSCIDNARNPKDLVFGVCLQYDNYDEKTSSDILDNLQKEHNIKIIKYNYCESKGGSWARNIAQKLYDNEEYHLQIDSHTRLVKDWDIKCIELIHKLKQKSEKPYISFLPPCYFFDEETNTVTSYTNLDKINKLNVPKIKFMSTEYWVDYGGYDNEKYIEQPVNIPLLYGGFIFSEGQWVIDIEQDPEHYYTGEEFALVIRSYTHGYDCYLPNEILAWHRGNGNNIPKHFTKLSDGKIEHRKAMERLKILIEGGDLGKYGLGTKRTLDEYERFANLDFKNKKVIDNV